MSRAYIFAFNVGLGGVLMMFVLAALLPDHMLLILSTAAAWTLSCMFVVPWLYVWYETNESFPWWFVKGPHS